MSYVMSILSALLVLGAVLLFVMEMAAATTAPQQAVAAGQACFIGILARIAQASAHNLGGDKTS